MIKVIITVLIMLIIIVMISFVTLRVYKKML